MAVGLRLSALSNLRASDMPAQEVSDIQFKQSIMP
jgi:hypothetical protein